MAMWPKRCRPTTSGARLDVPGRVLEVEVVARIAVRPAVHGDGEDVARGIESAGAEQALQHASHFALVILERHRQHLRPSGTRLAPRGRRSGCGAPKLANDCITQGSSGRHAGW